MRVISVILGSAIVGTAVGAATAYFEVHTTASPLPEGTPTAQDVAAATAAGKSGNFPRASVDTAVYNFGTMQRGTSKSHEFLIRNVGHAPLTVRVGSTTCKCTVGNVDDKPVPPGESVHVKLEWKALVAPGPFRQMATILTNDPLESRLELSVEGEVSEASGISPQDFIFDKVAAGESRSASVYVMAIAQDEELHVGEPELSNPEMRAFFDVKLEPVEKSELPNPKAKQGVKITVTAKPGLPLGRFDQWLIVPTNIPEAEKLEIPVVGRIVGNISVHGRFWNEEQAVLKIGPVMSDEGISTPLNIVIRGDGADAVSLSVASTDPPELLAKLGEPQKIKPTLVHVPLTVEIPKGTPPMARLNTQQSDEAKIVLKTNYPGVPEMVIGVRFAVER